MFMFMFMECMAGERFGENEEKGLSNGFRRSDMEPFRPFFLDLVDIFLFRVWIPSFFIVSGRLTCNEIKQIINTLNMASHVSGISKKQGCVVACVWYIIKANCS